MAKSAALQSPLRRLRLLAPAIAVRRGGVLIGLAVGGSLLQSLVDLSVALLLLLFLQSLGLVDAAALPHWLPLPVRGGGPVEIWAVLLLLAGAQSILQVVSHQSKVLVAERVHTRLRTVLAFRALVQEGVPPPSLSRMSYFTSEIFPGTEKLVFDSLHVSSFLIQAGSITLAMLYVAPGDALVSLITLGACAALVLHLNRLNNRAAALLLQVQEAYERSKVRITRNWLLIRALRLQDREYVDMLGNCAACYRYRVRADFFANLGPGLGPLLSVLLLGVVVLTHLTLLHAPAADLIPFLYLLFRFQQMLANGSYILGGLFTHGNHAVESARFLADFSDADLRRAVAPAAALGRMRAPDPQNVGCEELHDGQQTTASIPPRMTVQDVAFDWPCTDGSVFSNLSLELPAGAQLGIVGANGTGKSTFLAVLLGVLRPNRGSVLLDGLDSATWVSCHREAVGFVGAESYLVEGSIRDNLVYGLGRAADDAELWLTLERVGLAGRVRSLEQALDHPIEEGGEGLSTGEKQKLCIAHALLRRPVLLVLDEPTANVDEESERDIVDAMRRLKGRCTVVLVSHKPAVLLYTDRRCDFDAVSSLAVRSGEQSVGAPCAAAGD